MDCSLSGSSVRWIYQAEYWHRLQFPSPGHLPDPEIESMSHILAVGFFNAEPPGKPVHGILQARILEWVVISFSRDLPNLGTEHVSLMSPALAGRFFTTSTTLEVLKSI